jgi:small conductance mechanosensitive channel
LLFASVLNHNHLNFMLDLLRQAIAPGLYTVILPLAIIIIMTLVSLRIVGAISKGAEKRILNDPEMSADRLARLQTVRRFAHNAAQGAILTIAVLLALATVGIDIGPILAAAGIVGLAVSLGAQTLIKDFIGGLTILLEDQFRVGDSIIVGSVVGDVERISLRHTQVRDMEGRLYIIPNGDVRIVANETREWSRALFEINLPYNADINKAVEVLAIAMTEAAADPAIQEYLLDRPEIFGWNQFNDRGVRVRLRAKVQPGKQGEVARVLRRHALYALRDGGIEFTAL